MPLLQVYGTPSPSLLAMSQPVALRVAASDGKGGLAAVDFVVVLESAEAPTTGASTSQQDLTSAGAKGKGKGKGNAHMGVVKTCDELEWPISRRAARHDVCSRAPAECEPRTSKAMRNACKRLGARVCSVGDLLSRASIGLEGCDAAEWAWVAATARSSAPFCPPDQGRVVALRGAGSGSATAASECRALTEEHAGTCCADFSPGDGLRDLTVETTPEDGAVRLQWQWRAYPKVTCEFMRQEQQFEEDWQVMVTNSTTSIQSALARGLERVCTYAHTHMRTCAHAHMRTYAQTGTICGASGTPQGRGRRKCPWLLTANSAGLLLLASAVITHHDGPSQWLSP